MRVRFEGDHGDYHCGSRAVSDVIRAEIARVGALVPREADYDALVVNGEGSMHHGSSAFHAKMRLLAQALDQGKRAYLVNSLWQDNPAFHDDALARLDGMSLRGVVSQSDLARRHGLSGGASIDLSFFAPVDEEAPFADLGGAVAYTDLWSPDFGFLWPQPRPTEGWIAVDMRAMSWSSLVKTLRTARMVVTGRHHAMYAACRARTPFVPIRGNSHKFADLLASAKAPVPICRAQPEIDRVIAHAARSRPVFERLFDWMEAQRPWRLEDAPAPRRTTQVPAAAYPAAERAKMAGARADYAEAGAWWERAAREAADPTPMRTIAGDVLVRAGEAERGLAHLYAARAAAPTAAEPRRRLWRLFNAALWERPESSSLWREGGEDWGPLALRASQLAERGEDAAAREAGAEAVRRAAREDATAGAAARLFLAMRFGALARQRFALDWWRALTPLGEPDWLADEDLFFFLARTDLYAATTAELTARFAAGPSAATPEAAELLARQAWRAGAEAGALATRAAEAWRAHAAHQPLHELATQIAIDAGDDATALALAHEQPAFFAALARRRPAVAGFAQRHDLARDEATLEMAALHAHLTETARRLTDAWASGARSVAIVGNAGNEVGSGRGPEIDAHDDVVRFNAYRLSAADAPDYGARVTVAVTRASAESAAALHRRLPPETTILLAGAGRLHDEPSWAALAPAMREGRRFCCPLHDARTALARALRASPSTGLTACAWIKSAAPALARSDCYGFAFDQSRYFAGARISEEHDWAAERRRFEALFTPQA